MRRAFVLTLGAVAMACSDRTAQQTGPSTIPPPSSRVVLSGTVSAAAGGTPIPNVQLRVVEGVNTDRTTVSDALGHFMLPDLEPGTFTLLFSSSEYLDLRRTEVVRADTTLNVQLQRKGLTVSGLITTQWGEPVDDVGVAAIHDGREFGGGASTSNGTYRIPTLPAMEYLVRARKWGYLDLLRPLTLTGDATLDFVLDRVRVSIFGAVSEAAPCRGDIDGARVEIVSGPDTGRGDTSSSTGYELRNINWGKFRLRATRTGYVPAEVSMDVLSPGSRDPFQGVDAPSTVRQDFRLQRTASC